MKPCKYCIEKALDDKFDWDIDEIIMTGDWMIGHPFSIMNEVKE